MAAKLNIDLPMPFGWFALMHTEDLAVGDVKPMEAFDTELVVWRGEDGKPRALDAYCRHMGAHLGYGGAVVGNDIRCPFHHWQFNGQGGVTEIPYTPQIPSKLMQECMVSWPMGEAHGMVYAWYHPDRVAPLWEIASPPELESGDWVRIDKKEWLIPIHTQEITENGTDFAHFRAIHGTKSPPEPELTIDGENRESIVRAKMETPRGLVDGSIHVRNTGPGQSFVRFGGISELIITNLPLPLGPQSTLLRQDFYIPRDFDEKAQRSARALARNVASQVDQDIPIWRHKRYQPRPLLVPGDGPIHKYRKQYARYYTTPPQASVEQAPGEQG